MRIAGLSVRFDVRREKGGSRKISVGAIYTELTWRGDQQDSVDRGGRRHRTRRVEARGGERRGEQELVRKGVENGDSHLKGREEFLKGESA